MHTPAILCSSCPVALPPSALRASFGVGDSLFLLVLALIVFGPKKLPEISRQLGKLVFEFRRASNDFKLQIEDELRAAEQTDRQKQLAQQAATAHEATAVALSATESVSAADGAETGAAASDDSHGVSPLNDSAEPVILPPSTGAQVSAAPPHRFRSDVVAEAALPEPVEAQNAAAGEELGGPRTSIEEMHAAAREAGVDESELNHHSARGGSQQAEPAATHHG